MASLERVPGAQGGGMTRLLLGTACDDIGTTAHRLAGDVSGAMPRPPEVKEHGDGETVAEVGQPTDVSSTIDAVAGEGCAGARVV